jgi:hypothetical protein
MKILNKDLETLLVLLNMAPGLNSRNSWLESVRSA